MAKIEALFTKSLTFLSLILNFTPTPLLGIPKKYSPINRRPSNAQSRTRKSNLDHQLLINRTETSLTFSFDQASRSRCGVVREEDGVLSAVVVVQPHTVIQRKGDKAVQILCYFETGEKVVTNSYDVVAK